MTTQQFPHYFAGPLRSNRMLSSSEEAVIRTYSSISRLDVQIKHLLLRRHTLYNHRQMLAGTKFHVNGIQAYKILYNFE